MFKKETCWLCLAMTGLFVGMAGGATLAPDGGSIVGNLSLWLRTPELNLDTGTGIWADVSGKGNDAEPVGEVAGRTYIAPTLSSGNSPIVLDNNFSAVKFGGGMDDLLRASNLNSGAGLNELTIISVHKLTDLSGGQRPVGFGSWNDGSVTNNFNLQVGDGSIRKDNGFVGAGNTAPLDLFFISIARMNPSSVDQWYNSNGTLEHVQSVSGSSYTTANDNFYLGDVRASGGDTEIAEVLVYNTSLSETQIEGISEWLQANVGIAMDGRKQASNPSPADGATDLLREVALSWIPVGSAVQRNVYLGTVFDDVNAASPEMPLGVLVSQDLDVNTCDTGPLAFGQTYFWRVDEVNGTPDKTVFRGDVWSFEVEPYSIEIPGAAISVSASSYGSANDPNHVIDGSGMTGHTHSSGEQTAWQTAPADPKPWIQFAFPKAQPLDKMVIWNSNSGWESILGLGAKDIVLETSLDGDTWTVVEDVTSLTQAPGNDNYNTPDQLMLNGLVASQVRVSILSTWLGNTLGTGLSEVKFYTIPVFARSPEPASGTVDVLPDSILSWRAGRQADQHTIYISDDPNAVIDGLAPSVSSPTNGVDLSALDLHLDKTYYWRVDEVNETEITSVWPGPVWSLSTSETLIVDDFESYSNLSPNRPFQTWLDGIGYSVDEFFPVEYKGNGTGSSVGHDIWSVSSPHFDGTIMETVNTIAGSAQSMPFYYSNTDGAASQTERTFAVPQDWTVGGVQTLSIAFCGQAGNTGTLYVKINDTKVTYDRDPGNLAVGVWQAWNIDLSSMNVQAVTTLQIGVEGSGASGMLLIDDIRLHAEPGQVITPVDPGIANLVGAWNFDEGSGTVAADSSGNGRTGTLFEATWDAGIQGSALFFNDTSYVETGYAGVTGTASRTCSAWIKTVEADRTILSWGLNTVGNKWRMRLDVTGGLRIEVNGGNHVGQAFLADDEWHHTAVVLQDDGTPDCSETLLYVDGLPETTHGVAGEPIDTDPTGEVRIGKSPYHTAGFIGLIDDVRIYDRALSDAEVRSLAGKTTPVDKPF